MNSISGITKLSSARLRAAVLLCALSLTHTAALVHPAKDIVGPAVGAGSFNTLVTAVEAAGLVDTLRGDAATTAINGAQLLKTDVQCSHGVIHGIDTVILPPDANQDVVDTLASNDAFGTLVTAAGAATLVGTHKSSRPFTVFARTDAAFAKLPGGTPRSMLPEAAL
jgi:uncharacterized surface protein with fasciclin (FAS1) repeats